MCPFFLLSPLARLSRGVAPQCEADPGAFPRRELFGTPTVWRDGAPFVWHCRQSVFRRYCRSWWDLHPHGALVHGKDPFWAKLEEQLGGVPADTVVNVVAIGTDGVNWGARLPPTATSVAARLLVGVASSRGACAGAFTDASDMSMVYIFNVVTDAQGFERHTITCVQKSKVPPEFVSQLLHLDFPTSCARADQWPAVHALKDDEVSEEQKAAYWRRKAAGAHMYDNNLPFYSEEFGSWFVVRITLVITLLLLHNGDLMDKRDNMGRTSGNASYINNPLTTDHKVGCPRGGRATLAGSRPGGYAW